MMENHTERPMKSTPLKKGATMGSTQVWAGYSSGWQKAKPILDQMVDHMCPLVILHFEGQDSGV